MKSLKEAMKSNDITQGVRCLRMHPLRTFLSTLGVLFGVVSVIAMLAIGEGSKQEILHQIEQLGSNNIIIRQSELSEEQHQKATEATSLGLTIEDARNLQINISTIQKNAGLKVVKAAIGGVSYEVSPEILAVTASYGDIKLLELSEGRFLSDFDVAEQNHFCVLGAEIASKLSRWGHVGQTIRIDNLQFQIVGVLDNMRWSGGKTRALSTRNLNNSIFVPLGVEKGFSMHSSPSGNVLTEIVLQFPDRTFLASGSAAIKRMMELLHKGVEDYQIIIPIELLDQATKTQNIFTLVLGGLAAISMLVGGIGIMNIMLATISVRTREVGIRRAVGASQYHIAKQFLTETLILTLVGVLLGVVGGVVLSHLIGLFAGWSVIVTGWSILLAVGMAVFVGIASGLYPAYKAASMDPLTALRHL